LARAPITAGHWIGSSNCAGAVDVQLQIDPGSLALNPIRGSKPRPLSKLTLVRC
jgi:hypothetical protein